MKIIKKKVLKASQSMLMIEKDMCPFISNVIWKFRPALELDTEVPWIMKALEKIDQIFESEMEGP